MQEKKSRQHHVWKHHLGAWATDGKVWCRQDGRSFLASPANLAVENEYYRLQKLNKQDKEVARLFAVTDRTDSHRQLAETVLSFLDHPYQLLDRLRAVSPEAAAAMRMDVVEVNYVEDFFALIEDKMCPILDKIRNKDLSSASCPTEAPWLFFFLATQYFRTKTTEKRLLAVLTPEVRSRFACDWDRVWKVMRVVMACQVGASLLDRLELAEWTILESPSNFDLITSDQPLFNTKADARGEDGYVRELSFYFPVTPRFAVLGNFNSTAPGVRTLWMPVGNARHFNQKISEQAYRQVFARRRDELDLLT